jgi:hypothetical protein
MPQIIFTLIAIISNTAFAKTETLEVIQVTHDDRAIVEASGEKWLLELGTGCYLNHYVGSEVFGEYTTDPNSAGAKLILPDHGECIIWGGTPLNSSQPALR